MESCVVFRAFQSWPLLLTIRLFVSCSYGNDIYKGAKLFKICTRNAGCKSATKGPWSGGPWKLWMRCTSTCPLKASGTCSPSCFGTSPVLTLLIASHLDAFFSTSLVTTKKKNLAPNGYSSNWINRKLLIHYDFLFQYIFQSEWSLQ
jgi:hypothetical protein